MHDPWVVAFDIRRPWPRIGAKVAPGKPRWSWPRCGAATFAGRQLYFPGIATVWHVEPGGRDSGEVCKHYRRYRKPDGTLAVQILNGWRFHVHHWRIQVFALQDLRRWLLTRCTWCGGHHRRNDPVNTSLGWGRERGPWWRGERGLYHADCSSVAKAHRTCVCEEPVGDRARPCGNCGNYRRRDLTPATLRYLRALAAFPVGHRDRARYEQLTQEWHSAERDVVTAAEAIIRRAAAKGLQDSDKESSR